MKISCQVASTKTYYLTLTQAEVLTLLRLVESVSEDTLALMSADTSLDRSKDLIEDAKVQDVMIEEFMNYGRMIKMIEELKFLRRM